MFNNNEIEVRFNEFLYGKAFKPICDLYPIISAKKTEKSWWKKMKLHYDVFFSNKRDYFKTTSPTIKYCPGIYDFTNAGYILPAWQDFQFWVNDDGDVEWEVPEQMGRIENITAHPKEQVDTSPILGETASYLLKLISPWSISTSKGTSLIYGKPFYHYSNDFDVCPGVIDSDMDRGPNKEINVFIRFNVRNKIIHIKAGQPLMQIIPFKRRNWKLTYVKMDKNFRTTATRDQMKLSTRFAPRIEDKDSLITYRNDDSNKKFDVYNA